MEKGGFFNCGLVKNIVALFTLVCVEPRADVKRMNESLFHNSDAKGFSLARTRARQTLRLASGSVTISCFYVRDDQTVSPRRIKVSLALFMEASNSRMTMKTPSGSLNNL